MKWAATDTLGVDLFRMFNLVATISRGYYSPRLISCMPSSLDLTPPVTGGRQHYCNAAILFRPNCDVLSQTTSGKIIERA